MGFQARRFPPGSLACHNAGDSPHQAANSLARVDRQTSSITDPGDRVQASLNAIR
ncbi:hypothetical protein RBWH47_02417 [Rhodopirellula baltica WH47]|uniref:Uncharacterized protein n=1 Tax=Rhodopirellula baltica WH47 TaxID=991778 RepID=F2AYB5_RHOBT|nr:hypothetical protein RBWH47_02417 [Rhodopirellula baltica WH47]